MRASTLVSVLVLLAGGCASRNEPEAVDRQTLRLVALPDLSRAPEPVQAQLRGRYAVLIEKKEDPGIPASELGTGYGEMGMLLTAAEFRDQAEASFLNAQALAPGDMRWPYYLAHLYKTKGDMPNATLVFERALQLAPDDVPTMIWLGEADLNQGRPDAAESHFRKALTLQPRSVSAHYGLGRAALARADYARAAHHLEQALAFDDKRSIIHYSMAMAYRGLGDSQRAESHLRQFGTERHQPDDPLMKLLDGLLDSALSYETRGDAALKKGDWAAAVEYFRKGVALAPERAALHHQLGTALFYTGDRSGAVEQFQEAVRLAPTFAKAHYSLGVIQESIGQHQQAVKFFSSAVAAQPDYAEARLHLANALRRSGQVEASLSQYEQIFGIDPTIVEAPFGYIAALIRLKRYQEARDRVVEAIDRYPDAVSFARVAARLFAAAPDDRVRDGRRAVAMAQLLLDRQPRTIELAETMAMASAEVGQYGEAIGWQQQAMDAAAQAGRRDVVERLRGNLTLYQARRPCRTPWRADEPIEF
jgi:tetratricopeptide (TPR) repeat protein